MPDLGAKYTDEQIVQMEKQLKSVYNQAYKDILQKQKDFNEKYAKKEAKYAAQVANGQITQEQFDSWKKGQVFQGEQWQNKKKDILNTIYNSNKIATDIVNGKTQNVFAFNANYMSYELEHGAGVNFGFSLYDSATVVNLIKNDPQLLPKWKIDQPKDYAWNQKKLNRQISLGIIEGESLDKIANRLSDSLATQNFNKMRTFARTAMTGAQNSGRQISLNNAKGLGIKLKKEWMATLDHHTRINHRLLDGQKVNTDDYFEVNGLKIRYPGDPQAVPAMTYNCRCTMVGDIDNYPATYNRYDNIDGKPIKNMSYKEWKAAKSKGENISPVPLKYSHIEWEAAKKKSKSSANTIINGKDISAAWKRRPDQFDFEIEDVINAQGFDGKPRVVSAEEFDEAVKKSNFVAQRAYSAPDQETLDAYRDQLYNGKWYVDCSTGGARHGQGMYCVADYSGNLTDDMRFEASAYAGYYGNRPSYIETFTVDPSAKFIEEATIREKMNAYNDELLSHAYRDAISETTRPESITSMIDNYKKYFGVTMTPDDMAAYMKGMQLQNMKSDDFTGSVKKQTNQIIKKYKLKDHSLVQSAYRNTDAYKNASKKEFSDIGSFAAAEGWDGIKVSGREGQVPYAVILNRTKVIIKGE